MRCKTARRRTATDWLKSISRPTSGGAEDVVGAADVSPDGRGLDAGQQRPGVRHHHRIVVRVHHAGVRVDALRDLMHVLIGGQPGADVQELRDSLAGARIHRPLQEATILAGEPRELRDSTRLAIRGFPVGREVILAAQPVVVHPGDVRDRRVEFQCPWLASSMRRP
jgi:hypothetical protein